MHTPPPLQQIIPERRDRDVAPKVVYAYRAINDNLRDSLIKRHFWFSSPLRFNDPYDCDLPISEACNPEDAKQCVENLLLRHPAPSVEFEERVFAEARSGKLIRGSEMISTLKALMMKRSGVICFSEDPDNVLMWSHYGDKHHGVCLGFESNKLPNDLHRVEYSDFLPCIKWNEWFAEDNSEAKKKLYLTKSNHWRYEHEWRMVRDWPLFKGEDDPHRAVSFQPESLKRVIFGSRIKPERRDELMLLLSRWPTKIYFYQAESHRTRFKASIRAIK